MQKVFYNKLVRDNIKSKIEAKGESCSVRVIEDEAEFNQELLKKVFEEAQALSKTRTKEEFLAEYADLVIVLETLKKQLNISEQEISQAVESNKNKKGLFKNKHFLAWSEDVDYNSNETPQGIIN